MTFSTRCAAASAMRQPGQAVTPHAALGRRLRDNARAQRAARRQRATLVRGSRTSPRTRRPAFSAVDRVTCSACRPHPRRATEGRGSRRSCASRSGTSTRAPTASSPLARRAGRSGARSAAPGRQHRRHPQRVRGRAIARRRTAPPTPDVPATSRVVLVTSGCRASSPTRSPDLSPPRRMDSSSRSGMLSHSRTRSSASSPTAHSRRG